MNAPNDNATASGSGMRGLITPWAYRHLRAIAGVRFAAGAPAAALVKLSGPTSWHQDTAHGFHGEARRPDASL